VVAWCAAESVAVGPAIAGSAGRDRSRDRRAAARRRLPTGKPGKSRARAPVARAARRVVSVARAGRPATGPAIGRAAAQDVACGAAPGCAGVPAGQDVTGAAAVAVAPGAARCAELARARHLERQLRRETAPAEAAPVGSVSPVAVPAALPAAVPVAAELLAVAVAVAQLAAAPLATGDGPALAARRTRAMRDRADGKARVIRRRCTPAAD
jgi:hypothetical protein